MNRVQSSRSGVIMIVFDQREFIFLFGHCIGLPFHAGVHTIHAGVAYGLMTAGSQEARLTGPRPRFLEYEFLCTPGFR